MDKRVSKLIKETEQKLSQGERKLYGVYRTLSFLSTFLLLTTFLIPLILFYSLVKGQSGLFGLPLIYLFYVFVGIGGNNDGIFMQAIRLKERKLKEMFKINREEEGIYY